MAEFCINISNITIAEQISNMLNNYNKLDIIHNSATIINLNVKYFVEIDFPGRVVACVALQDEHTHYCIRHVCVLPEYRNMGIAKKLIQTALTNARKGNIFMTIREENTPSLKMAASLGFKFVERIWKYANNHYVIKVVRSV